MRALLPTLILAVSILGSTACVEFQCNETDITCNAGISFSYLAFVNAFCAQLDWRNTESKCWPVFSAALQSAQAAGDCGAPSVNLIGPTFGLTQKWAGGVLATDGNIYGIVQNRATALQINPAAGTAGDVGAAISPMNGWRGGVLSHNEKIYAFPSSTNLAILEYDPATLTSVQFYTGTGAGPPMRGGAVAPDGTIYSVPDAYTSVLKIDPDTRTVTEIPVGASGWRGAVLGPTGLIYGVPTASSDILVIDPRDDSIRTIPTGFSGYAGAVVTASGLIYMIPSSATAVMVFNPFTETVATFGSLAVGAEKWVGGALAPNGKIYAPPGSNGADMILIIDPATNTTSLLPSGLGGSQRWWGAVAAENGRVYAIPFSGTRVLEIDTCSNGRLDRNVLLSGFFNKF